MRVKVSLLALFLLMCIVVVWRDDALLQNDYSISAEEQTSAVIKNYTLAEESKDVPSLNDKTRFKAYPVRPIVRGKNSLLLYPEMIVSAREYTPGKVFEQSPLYSVTENANGPLAYSELTKVAYESSLDLSVVEAFLQSDAEYLPLPIGGGEEVLLSVKRTHDRGENTITLFGNTNDSEVNESFVVFHDGSMYGSVHEVYPYRMFEYAESGDGDVVIRHLDETKDLYGSCELAENPELIQPNISPEMLNSPVLKGAQNALPKASVYADEGLNDGLGEQSAGLNFDPSDQQVDMVITYIAAAATEIGGVSAAEAKIIAHIDSTTQLFVNSLISDAVFNLLGTAVETVDLGGIVRPDEPADHNSLQAQLGADISGKMYSGAGGVAWTPNGAYVYEGFQFGNLFAASSGSSFPHEVCHNFGALHSYGDGSSIETNDLNSYGWRFRVQGYNYRTVMSYTTQLEIGVNAANSYGPRIGYLSDPDQNYDAPVTSGTVSIPLGVVDGFDGSSYAYMDPSLLYGGRNATFTFNDNGTPTNYNDDTFTYVSGGIVTNGYNGNNPNLGANNNDIVRGRVTLHETHNTRASYSFIEQPLSAYASSENLSFSVFAGSHNDVAQVDLYQNGSFVQTLDASGDSYVTQQSWQIPETGITSGSGYQIYVTAGGSTVQSSAFSLTISQVLPIAHYKLDEVSGSTLFDSSGNGRDATLLSGKIGCVDSVSGRALELDADDTASNRGFSAPNSIKAEITDEVTIMLWAKGDASLPRQTTMISGGGLNVHLPWTSDNTTGSIIWDAGYDPGPNRLNYVASSSEYKEQWNHYAFTKSVTSGEMQIYINGVLVTSNTGMTFPLDGTGSLHFGSANASGVFAYDGIIDDVQIYNQVLTETKINALKDEAFQDSELLAYYKLDETSGTTIKDDSIFKNDGTLGSGNLNYTGKRGSGFELDYDASHTGFTAPSGITSQITDEISVSFWAYGDASLPRTYNANVLTGGNIGIILPLNNGWILWDHYAATLERANYQSNDTADIKGQWNHYAFTRNTTTGQMGIYLNGEQKVLQAGMTQPLVMTGSLYIGGGYGGSASTYDGVLDEFKIYRKALSLAEVKADYQAGLSGFDAWKFVYDEQSLPVENTGFAEDAEGDGVVNGLEYVFGSDPADSASSGEVEQVQPNASNVVFGFDRRVSSVEDTLQTFQFSSDLDQWTDVLLDSPRDSKVTVSALGNGMERVTVSIPEAQITETSIVVGRLKVSEQ